jgi:hypothetical protein
MNRRNLLKTGGLAAIGSALIPLSSFGNWLLPKDKKY